MNIATGKAVMEGEDDEEVEDQKTLGCETYQIT